ncbi:transmembrane protein 215 [Hemicordylus capensis]|uniref:transmembrane protein 215 n=1 Tax=Hemicordylus capensis TaxID=884348 RepID=UPI0023023BB4|nr:transmembrane protein 215 [Hemicordylus capensis]
MRPDDINPRTGLVVALVSVFLVFGFMFTVSGIKGETLGDIPLLAIGPAICLPGIAAIALARKTDGCTKWPENRCCPPCRCCRKKPKDKDALELLRTPSDLESGRGSCDELAKKAAYAAQGRKASHRGEGGGGGDSVSIISTCTTITTAAAAATGECKSLLRKAEQEEMLRYLENCYPEMPGNVFVADATPYRALEEQQQGSPVLEGAAAAAAAAAACPDTEDNIFVAPRDSIIVCSYKENSPYDRYCCYINPSEEVSSDHETII